MLVVCLHLLLGIVLALTVIVLAVEVFHFRVWVCAVVFQVPLLGLVEVSLALEPAALALEADSLALPNLLYHPRRIVYHCHWQRLCVCVVLPVIQAQALQAQVMQAQVSDVL